MRTKLTIVSVLYGESIGLNRDQMTPYVREARIEHRYITRTEGWRRRTVERVQPRDSERRGDLKVRSPGRFCMLKTVVMQM